MSTWTFSQETGEKDAVDLANFQIVATGDGYDLLDANGNVLDSQPFVEFSYTGGDPSYDWTITVTTLGDTIAGTWTNNDETITGEEDGGWTAQAGGGPPDPVSASSASVK